MPFRRTLADGLYSMQLDRWNGMWIASGHIQQKFYSFLPSPLHGFQFIQTSMSPELLVVMLVVKLLTWCYKELNPAFITVSGKKRGQRILVITLTNLDTVS